VNIKKSLQISTFKDIPDIVGDYSENIPVEFLDLKRGEGFWTIREHLYHIAGVQDMLLGRMNIINNEENPVIKPFFPENDPSSRVKFSSIGNAIDAYKKLREEQVELILSLPEEILKKNARHEEYREYNIPLIVHHMIYHEYWHMYRIEELWLTRDQYLK